MADVRHRKMTIHRIPLPLLVYIPDGWAVGESARLCSYEMTEIGRIVHNQTTTKRLWGLAVSLLDTASLYIGNKDTASCSIKLPGSMNFEIYDDTDNLGQITPKTFSVFPELECRDGEGKIVGLIRPRFSGVKILEANRTTIGRYPGEAPRRPFAGQAVWVFTSEEAKDIDGRLILGSVTLELVPSSGGD